MKEFEENEFEGASEFDGKTGEELYAEFLCKVERPKDEFVYYYDKYFYVMGSLTGSARDLLFWMALNTDVNTGRVYIQSRTMKGALNEMGITVGTYYKALNQLKEFDLIKGKNAEFFVNPVYLWKGSPDARMKFLKVYPRL